MSSPGCASPHREFCPVMGLDALPVRVDKSHLVTIGERQYAESIELIRELVNIPYVKA